MWYVVTHGYFEDVSNDDHKESGYVILKFTYDPYTLFLFLP